VRQTKVQRAASGVQRPACSVQRAACSVQRPACSVQRAACSVQRAERAAVGNSVFGMTDSAVFAKFGDAGRL